MIITTTFCGTASLFVFTYLLFVKQLHYLFLNFWIYFSILFSNVHPCRGGWRISLNSNQPTQVDNYDRCRSKWYSEHCFKNQKIDERISTKCSFVKFVNRREKSLNQLVTLFGFVWKLWFKRRQLKRNALIKTYLTIITATLLYSL